MGHITDLYLNGVGAEDASARVPAALRSHFAVAFVHRRSVDAVPSARDAAVDLRASRPKAGHHALDVVVAGKGESVPRADEDEHQELLDCVHSGVRNPHAFRNPQRGSKKPQPNDLHHNLTLSPFVHIILYFSHIFEKIYRKQS
ncbi:hypothetical protein BLNAU_18046 [Blattamonas nauphoetae]|uniref:Uncharacterized protein n=1 Tax=Blattamonas nauphoetae TaxID=2049346 RepID=A0ABQ9X5K8_9EUKA|nr:hypothetical protein BLNAU_18046 [Blattamonas nauphoetae]